ncbi:MAG: phosphoglycerate kinase [bacterium]|nr:phosphoglycerate kinase [bacterium]
MKSITELTDIKGSRVLVRVDFNVPIKNGSVVDDFRLTVAYPTIKYLQEQEAKIILISHLDENTEGTTLRPVAEGLKKDFALTFVGNDIAEIRKATNDLPKGGIILVENIRNFKGEKENDENFARELASLADCYVNEAFPVSHRAHASIVGVPKIIPSYAGFRFQKEIEELSRTFNPPHPFLFILGGAKFETKEPLIQKFLDIADNVFVGGALGNDFFKGRGFEVGGSITSGKLPSSEILNNEKVIIPLDVIVRASDGRKVVRRQNEILANEIVSDAGPQTLEMLREKINLARTILWNGPLGLYEKGFDAGTKEVARMLSVCRGKSIVGGGDTTVAIESLGIADRLSFISTGGGAMLEFLAKGTLPGIEALKDSIKN